ncbi:PAS domain-containing protein [Clostridium malenominatum]|uniref:PAS domain-containing protein n=2 Tax=Clostridium malenominatum TaxID=1539 RepID=A0ABP3TUN4_9CLOT
MSLIYGKNCEVILYDITNPEHAVIAIHNNFITGRNLGDSISECEMNVINSNAYKNKNFLTNNITKSKNSDKIIRTSSYFIKDDYDNLIGMICVNIDLTSLKMLTDEVESFMMLGRTIDVDGKPVESHKENIKISLEELMLNLISETMDSFENRPSKMSIDEKKAFVSMLQTKGVFLLKGSVSVVADIMEVSEQTVYRYIKDNDSSISDRL